MQTFENGQEVEIGGTPEWKRWRYVGVSNEVPVHHAVETQSSIKRVEDRYIRPVRRTVEEIAREVAKRREPHYSDRAYIVAVDAIRVFTHERGINTEEQA